MATKAYKIDVSEFTRYGTQQYIASNAWDFFEKIYCISLAQRPDRQKQAKIEFERVGLAGRVEFLIVDRHPLNPEAGIYESHLICIRKGLAAGVERMLVFEDDVVFDRFDPVRLHKCVDFLSHCSDWDAFFLGCMVCGSKRMRHPHVTKIKYRSLSHAYAVNRRFGEILVGQTYQGVGYDDYLKSFRKNYYAIHPFFAFQSDSPSDNDKYLHLDKFRRLCGGLQRIQKWNELYFCHRKVVIAAHILLVLLIILWIL